MHKDEFQGLLQAQFERLRDLTATKGVEYARSDDDQLANFKRQGRELGVEPKVVLAIFLNKHLDAIKSFIKEDRTLSEPIEGRIDDAILYLILLKALLIDRDGVKVKRFIPVRPGGGHQDWLDREADEAPPVPTGVVPHYSV